MGTFKKVEKVSTSSFVSPEERVRLPEDKQARAAGDALYRYWRAHQDKVESSVDDMDIDELMAAEEHAVETLRRLGYRVSKGTYWTPPERAGKKSDVSDWCEGTLLGFTQI